ncbi:MAG: DUF2079 domain-containing protein [Thermoplasmata archaeon]|nr:DUF2079 domain-containing protein [Thermoplasmata archaeon]
MGVDSGPRPRLRGLARDFTAPALLLVAFFAVYVLVSFGLSVLRLEEFSTSNWDLGIFQQSLWASYHGHPLYEAGDWESYGSLSLLQVHPAFSLLLVVPFYAVYPSPYTLFAIQSVVAGAAAFPIYQIGLRTIGRPWPALGLAGLYLVSAPVLAANAYDFHLEAFLPLEISLLFLLWLSNRYYLGVLVAAIALLTLEVVPFLVAFLALYFAIPPLRTTAREIRTRLQGPAGGLRALWEWGVPAANNWLARRSTRWSVGLFLAAIVSYPLIRGVEWFVLPLILPGAPNLAAGIALVPTKAPGLGLALSWSTSSLTNKLEFWLLMVALFGFLPLFAPRVLLLQFPWFVFTLQSNLTAWSTLGFQYTFVAVAPLAIASVYGYPRAKQFVGRVAAFLKRQIARWRPVRSRGPTPRSHLSRWNRVRPRIASSAFLVIVAVILVSTNLAVGPLNPAKQVAAGPIPGYVVQYHPMPGFQNVVTAAALIPGSADVVASSNLFPLVANDLNAYALLWVPMPPGQMPFDFQHPPQFAFLATNQLFAVPGWLSGNLHRGDFGLLAVVWIAPPGAVFLYELGYEGPTSVIGPI